MPGIAVIGAYNLPVTPISISCVAFSYKLASYRTKDHEILLKLLQLRVSMDNTNYAWVICLHDFRTILRNYNNVNHCQNLHITKHSCMKLVQYLEQQDTNAPQILSV